MCTFAGILRSIHPRMVGLVRRSLLVAGLLFGFLLAGSALAHAETGPPPPIPVLGVEPVQLPDVPDVPALSDTIFSAQQAIASAPKVVTPVTKVVTSLTTDVTTSVVRTINPVVRPAVGVSTPVLAPLLGPPPATSRPTATAQPATPDVDPITDALVAQPVSAQPATVLTTTPIPVVQPQVLPVDVPFVPAISSATRLSAAPSPRVPLDDDGPIVDVTGGNSTCGSNPTGQMFGVSRSFFGPFADRLVGTGVRPGTGPPKWWFFDPHHHPS
jgi:hypothetical protein